MEGSKSVIQVRFANTLKPPPTASKLSQLQTVWPTQQTRQIISSLERETVSMQCAHNSLDGYGESYSDELMVPESPQLILPSLSPSEAHDENYIKDNSHT